MARQLTTKQRKFVKAKIAGKSGIQSALEAYDTTDVNTANQIAVDNLLKPTIAAALEAAYLRQGITIDAIVKPVADGLVAERTVIIGKENDAFADQVPDHAIRLKAAGMAAMWMCIGRDKDEGSKTVNFISISDTHKDKFSL